MHPIIALLFFFGSKSDVSVDDALVVLFGFEVVISASFSEQHDLIDTERPP